MMENTLRYPLETAGLKNRFITFRCRDYKTRNKTDITEIEFVKRPLCDISLPLPLNFSENINQEWGRSEILSTGSVFGKAINLFKGRTGESIFNRINAQTGIAANPSEEFMYQGPGFRTFDFNFEFVPVSQKELDVVKQIIALFKILCLPKMAKDTTYIAFPAVWEIEITGIEDIEGNLFAMGFKNRTFALTTTTPNYTPDGGWQSFHNGFPVKTALSLTFTELQPLYRQDFPGEPTIRGILNGLKDTVGL